MANFKIPNGPKQYVANLTNFLGVDFTSIDIDERRASNMVNLVNNNGFLETRPGYAQIGNSIGRRPNGIWNIDKPNDSFLVHAGTKLYHIDNTFTSWTEIKDGLNDEISEGFYVGEYFVILDGLRVMVYGKHDGINYTIDYIDNIGTVPNISINRNPDGTKANKNEDVNLIQPWRVNSFVGTANDTVYTLVEQDCDPVTPTAYKIKDDGTTQALTITTWDYVNGKVTFDTAPGVSPVDGADNVFIRYKKTNNTNVSQINSCSIGIQYGYKGNKNRLFISGNKEYPNIVWASQDDDPLYWPSRNYLKVGTAPITNFINLNDGTLGVQKPITDSDFSMYYIDSVIFNSKEAFSVNEGSYNIDCIAKHANANLLNDPLTLSSKGVYGLTTSSYGERYANERSYYIKKKLLEEPNLENAYAIVNGNKYYLAINNHIYVADSRYQSKVPQASTGSYSYQYEWYYWDNIPARILFNYNGDLYFATNDGKIMKFNDTVLDIDKPIKTRFETAFLNLGSISKAKTIKRVTVISKPDVDTCFTLGYVTDEGDTNIIVKGYEAIDYPRALQEKEKISKFMFIKFFLENETNKKMSFYQMSFVYIYSGNYRGE